MSSRALPPVTAPTGLRRVDAARHCGISAGHFDKLVREGVMPTPRDLLGVKVWVRQELDEVLFGLVEIGSEGGGTSCDAAFGL